MVSGMTVMALDIAHLRFPIEYIPPDGSPRISPYSLEFACNILYSVSLLSDTLHSYISSSVFLKKDIFILFQFFQRSLIQVLLVNTSASIFVIIYKILESSGILLLFRLHLPIRCNKLSAVHISVCRISNRYPDWLQRSAW